MSEARLATLANDCLRQGSAALGLVVTIFISTIVLLIMREQNFHRVRIIIPLEQWIASDVAGIDTKFSDVFDGSWENIPIFSQSPDIQKLFTLTNRDQILCLDIVVARFDDAMWSEHRWSIDRLGWNKPKAVGQEGISQFILDVNVQCSCRGIPAVDPLRTQSPEGTSVSYIAMGNPTHPVVMDVSSLTSDHREFGSISAISGSMGTFLGRIGSYFSVGQAFADESQLNPEQRDLTNGGGEQRQRKSAEPERIVGDPLRLYRQLSVGLSFLPPFSLLLLGLLCGVGGGNYFYRKRYFIGTALIGCGWLCGLLAWGITAGGWLL